MRINIRGAVVAAAVLALAMPAAAAQQMFTFAGTAFLAPSGSPIAALSALAGGTVNGSFIVDTQSASLQLTGPVGGQGEGAFLTGAVKSGLIIVNGLGGGVTLVSNANDAGGIFTVNNGGVPGNPNNRTDQMGYTTGSRVISGSIVQPYDIFGSLPPDVFFGSLFFGRTLQGPLANLPALVTDVSTRDFAGTLLGPVGNPLFMQITFRQGNPQGATLTGLPLQSLSIGNIQLTVTELTGVPEPQSWAMLIAGFGLIGTVMRRRRTELLAMKHYQKI